MSQFRIEALGPGKKFDGDKLKVHLLPLRALELVSSAPNHEEGVEPHTDIDLYYDAALDDLIAYKLKGDNVALAQATRTVLGMLDVTSVHALPGKALEVVTQVLEFGAKKYSENNWQNVRPASRYFDAALRHLFAWSGGTQNDTETGLPHLAHAACCLLFLVWIEDFEKRKVTDAGDGWQERSSSRPPEETVLLEWPAVGVIVPRDRAWEHMKACPEVVYAAEKDQFGHDYTGNAWRYRGCEGRVMEFLDNTVREAQGYSTGWTFRRIGDVEQKAA